MRIHLRCPECSFERIIPTSKIPESASMATCPKCEHKWRFRDPKTGAILSDSAVSEEISSSVNTGTPTQEPPLQQYNKEDFTTQESSKKQEELTGEGALDQADDKKNDNGNADDEKNDEIKDGKIISITLQSSTDDHVSTDDVPWEHPERYGFFGSFFHTIKRTMLTPKEFFTHMHKPTSLVRPSIYYAIIGLFQTLVLQVSSMRTLRALQEAAVTPDAQQFVQQIMESFGAPLLLVLTPVLMILKLLLFTSFIYLMLRLVHPDRADFGSILRVVAYSCSPLLLCIIPVLGAPVGLIWFIVNVFLGIKYALRLTWEKTCMTLVPLLLFWLALSFSSTNAMLASMTSVM